MSHHLKSDTTLKRSKLEETEMDITPMIDITFLLLIFFIVASKMDTPASAELPNAVANKPVMADKAIVINIHKEGTRVIVSAPATATEKSRVFSSDPDTQSTEITEHVNKFVQQDEKRQVLLQASGLVKHKDISRVGQAIGKVGADSTKSIFIAVKQVPK
jgi:biopolymer transport protein ExbD